MGVTQALEPKQALVERELPTSGNKASLVKRLLEWCDGELVRGEGGGGGDDTIDGDGDGAVAAGLAHAKELVKSTMTPCKVISTGLHFQTEIACTLADSRWKGGVGGRGRSGLPMCPIDEKLGIAFGVHLQGRKQGKHDESISSATRSCAPLVTVHSSLVHLRQQW